MLQQRGTILNKNKIILSSLTIILLVACFFIYRRSLLFKTTSANSHSGSINVTVVDGMTDTPISNATIVIPELKKQFTTDSNGIAHIDSIPIITDEHFDDILPQKWGEITLLVYKDGYLPYALFYTQVLESEVRQGPRVYLFNEAESVAKEPFSIIEGPDRAWVDSLVKKYNPN